MTPTGPSAVPKEERYLQDEIRGGTVGEKGIALRVAQNEPEERGEHRIQNGLPCTKFKFGRRETGRDSELDPCLVRVRREQKAASMNARFGAHFAQNVHLLRRNVNRFRFEGADQLSSTLDFTCSRD